MSKKEPLVEETQRLYPSLEDGSPEKADFVQMEFIDGVDEDGTKRKHTILSSGADENAERGNWSSKFDFLLSLLGYSVGLANIWRFPYLCYRNGGGAFLVPYWLFMFLVAIPLFFLEVSIGQFNSKSAVGIWNIVPIFKGAGYATVAVTLIVSCYYNVVLAYVVFYFVNSFTLGELPWASCDNEWNTNACLNYNNETLLEQYKLFRDYEKGNMTNDSHPGRAFLEEFNRTLKSPADEYFHRKVLQISPGLESPGSIVWQLVVCLLPVWIITGLCLIKGVKSSGKVVWVTATFPYVVLFILLIRGATLPGAIEGVKFYIIPKWERLLHTQVWCDAAFQVFYSLGPGWGGIVCMGSYNRFNNNCYRDSLIIPVLMGLTSIFAGFVVFCTVGFMAHTIGRDVSEVVEQGPGLAFIMYPEVLTKLPLSPLWAILFFLMLFTVGLDSIFVMLETSITTVWDELPIRFKINRGWILLVCCILLFLLGLPFVTQGGQYIFQITDTYSASFTVIAVCLLEIVAVAWIYGAERFLDDIKFMIGYRPNKIVWTFIWRISTTGIVIAILVVAVAQYSPLEDYNGYTFGPLSAGIGFGLALLGMIWIPLMAIVTLCRAKGTFTQRLQQSFRPSEKWGPALETYKQGWKTFTHIPPYARPLVKCNRRKRYSPNN